MLTEVVEDSFMVPFSKILSGVDDEKARLPWLSLRDTMLSSG